MAEHPIQGLMNVTMDKVRQMVDSNTIVGKPITTEDGTTILPVSKASFGFASAGTDFDASCVWRNHYNAADRKVEITVDIDYHETGEHFHEEFCEYTYDLATIRAALEKHGFALESVCDGETFGPLTEESQRYFFCATKQYTQLEE